MSLLFSGPAAESLAMPKAAPVGSPTVSGTILETMDAAGYTYMLVESGSGKTWVAIPETPVTKGATVSYYEGMVMTDFPSKTLNRTFDSVVFSPGIAGNEGQVRLASNQATADDSFSAAIKAEKSTGMVPPPPAEMSGGSAGAVVPQKEIAIEKSAAANGYTVGEIYQMAKKLNGQKVQVQGKVVKFNPLIMGKNWVHLQDGTGDPMKNSHDLVVTTSETAEVGSVITIEGQLTADKDFGAGYKYEAIVEDATIKKTK